LPASQLASQSVSQSRVFHSVSYRCFRRESRRSAVRDTTSTASLSRVRASTLVFRTFGLFRTAASQRRDLPPPEELFFLLHCVHPRRARVRARPRNMWHARGLVISSKLDSSSMQLRVHDLVERILCAALCGISRRSYRFVVSIFVNYIRRFSTFVKLFPGLIRPNRRATLIGKTLRLLFSLVAGHVHVEGCPNGITNPRRKNERFQLPGDGLSIFPDCGTALVHFRSRDIETLTREWMLDFASNCITAHWPRVRCSVAI